MNVDPEYLRRINRENRDLRAALMILVGLLLLVVALR